MSKLLVILPGGFHPYHAGHFALYQSAKKAFPNADLYVAATNDMSERPFPFALKEKLAKLAGVEPGHFIQVKSPFKAEEITKNYDPNRDVLVFVRSEKDRNEQPKPGGTKKDGSPAYFQPWTGKNLQPFSKHAYMAYLPTVEFGPGITSATQIRKAWPTLNDKRKLAMVMSLYPATQKNSKLAQNVVGMFDQVMGGQQGVAEGILQEISTVPAEKIFLLVKNIHGRKNDFYEGDISDRIYWFDDYKLDRLPISKINLSRWDVDERYVDELVDNIINKKQKIRPIIFDPIENSIIDGTHRANAYAKLGYKYIPAYIGHTKSNSYGQREDDELDEQGVAEAFGPLPKDNQQIRLGRHTVDIERVGLDKDYIGFAWHDSKGQEHYEEVQVGDLGSYDDLIKKIKQEISYQERQYTDQGVAEGSEAEAYKEKLLVTLPQMMRFYAKNVQGWKPSKEQMLAAVETGYSVMKHTGDVKQAGKAMMDELNTLHRMSQGQQGVAEELGMPTVSHLSDVALKQIEKVAESRYPNSIEKRHDFIKFAKNALIDNSRQEHTEVTISNISESQDYLEEK